jgi:enoyl-CoA hydratase/carnithine racemase
MQDLRRCRYEVADRVAWFTIERPEAMNAIDEDVLADLRSLVERVRADPGVRVLVVSGTGDAFCVGLDLALLARAFDDLGYFASVLQRLNAALLDLEALDVPVIASVNGTTRAGGFELLLACDLVVVADEARVADHHTAFGMMPGGGSTQRLPRKIGDQRAKALLLTARWLDGPATVAWGLALEHAPRADLRARTAALAAELAGKPRVTLGTIKDAMARGAGLPLADAVQLEIDTFVAFMNRSDAGHEGFRAYLQRREPSWR